MSDHAAAASEPSGVDHGDLTGFDGEPVVHEGFADNRQSPRQLVGRHPNSSSIADGEIEGTHGLRTERDFTRSSALVPQ